MHNASPKELLTTKEVAAALGRDRSKISRLVSAGVLKPAYTFPGATGAHLFRPADVDALRVTFEALVKPVVEVAA